MVSIVYTRSDWSYTCKQRCNRKRDGISYCDYVRTVTFFLQLSVKILNKGNIEFGNDSKLVAATSSSSIRGMSINMLYLDEFAFVEDAETFYTATYPVITSGKDSKVIITSTANGVGNMFHKIYESAVHGNSEYKEFLNKLV